MSVERLVASGDDPRIAERSFRQLPDIMDDYGGFALVDRRGDRIEAYANPDEGLSVVSRFDPGVHRVYITGPVGAVYGFSVAVRFSVRGFSEHWRSERVEHPIAPDMRALLAFVLADEPPPDV